MHVQTCERAPGGARRIAAAITICVLWLLAAFPVSAATGCQLPEYYRPGDSLPICTASQPLVPGNGFASRPGGVCAVSQYFRPGDSVTAGGSPCDLLAIPEPAQPVQRLPAPSCTISPFFRPGDSVPTEIASACAILPF